MATKTSKFSSKLEELKSYKLPELKVQIATLDRRGVPKTDSGRFGVQAKFRNIYTGKTEKVKGTVKEVREKLKNVASDPNLSYMVERENAFKEAKQDQEGKKLFESGFVRGRLGDTWVGEETTYKSREEALKALQTKQQEREQIKQEDENRKSEMMERLGPAYTEAQIEEMKKIGSPGAKLARENRKLTEGQEVRSNLISHTQSAILTSFGKGGYSRLLETPEEKKLKIKMVHDSHGLPVANSQDLDNQNQKVKYFGAALGSADFEEAIVSYEGEKFFVEKMNVDGEELYVSSQGEMPEVPASELIKTMEVSRNLPEIYGSDFEMFVKPEGETEFKKLTYKKAQLD